MSFLTRKNSSQFFHDTQKWLCSAKPWRLILRSWNEPDVIFLGQIHIIIKNPHDQKSVLVRLLKKFQGKWSATGTNFC